MNLKGLSKGTICLLAGILVLTAGTVWAGTINVDVNDPACVSGSGQPDPYSVVYCNIQDAVTDAASGDTINVADGTYGADPATGKCAYITKDGLSLIGESETGTIIDGAIGGVGSSGSYWPKGIHIQANNVTIQNFTVQGFTGDLVSTGGYGVLHRDYAHDTPGEGYIFYDGCSVDHVTVHSCYSVVYALCFTNLTVTNCYLHDNYSDGMFIARGSDGAIIHDNVVTNSGDQGIWVGKCWSGLDPSDNATIYNNTVNGAREGGICFVGSDVAEIYGNSITNVASEGWSVGALNLKDGPTNVNAYGNRIFDNNGAWNGYDGLGHGVGIDGSAGNINLYDNAIYGNTGLGVYNISTKSSSGTWEERLIEDELQSSSEHMTSGSPDKNSRGLVLAEGNWWGYASGPYNATTNPSATGDAVSDDVDYSPWWGADYVDDPHTSPWTWYVNTSNNSTIQEGIDAASASVSDVINVAAGTYTITSAIGVNIGVTITGDVGTPANVVVQYNPPSTSLNGFEIGAASITIQGLTISDCFRGVHFGRTDITSTGCTITNCVFDNNSENAIGEVAAENTTISNNTVTNCNMGIEIRANEATSLANRTEVTGNTISSCSQSCIQTYLGKYVYIYGNTISNTNDKGINIIRSGATGTADRIQVIGNTISETKWPGIQVIGAPHTYVYNNTLTLCNYYGADGTGDWDYASIHVQDDIGPTYSHYTVIDNNTVYDGINGIQTWSDNVSITNNEIYDMGLTYADEKIVGSRTYKNSGILVGSNWGSGDYDPTGVIIQYNSIHDNYWGLFYSPNVKSGVIAEYNWWGHPTGPYHETLNPGGLGDAVSDNVDFDPWLSDPVPVVLASFTATSSQGFIALNWVTASEINCHRWEIYRSDREDGEYARIGELSGHGSTETDHTYQWVDRQIRPEVSYYYKLKQVDFDGSSWWSHSVSATATATATVPKTYALHQNYPNPFNPATEISYAIPRDEHVTLKVYNVLGAEVANLVDGHQRANFYTVRWDAGDLASGLYFCRLQAGDFGKTVKMILLK